MIEVYAQSSGWIVTRNLHELEVFADEMQSKFNVDAPGGGIVMSCDGLDAGSRYLRRPSVRSNT